MLYKEYIRGNRKQLQNIVQIIYTVRVIKSTQKYNLIELRGGSRHLVKSRRDPLN